MSGPPNLIVSANDAKLRRVAGKDTYLEDPPPDTVSVIDASRFPPRVVASIAVEASIVGPPQAVAITPDGRLVVVSAPNRYDKRQGTPVFGTHLQIVDLAADPARVISTIDVGFHPQGLAISRDGSLLLAATVGGTVAVLVIEGADVRLVDRVEVSRRRLAGVALLPDRKSALVALRDEQGIAVLDVAGSKVSDSGERITTGIAPYALDVAADGRWAVVGNVGLAGLGLPSAGKLIGDSDSFTVIDVARRPFRAVQHCTVPSIPEGVAISPDGRWIAVLAMNGSNLPVGNPGRAERGRLQLFELRAGHAERVASLPAGESAQGVVFSADGRYVLAQFFVDCQIAVYAVNGGAMQDTGVRIDVPGGPASLRAMPC
jgi:DNA-binding beta-propeller fold protein YncE